MSTIFLDGTSVDFSGPPPQSLLALRQILSQHLESQQRLLVRFEVDGTDLLNTDAQKLPSQFKKVEAISEAQSRIFLKLIEKSKKPALNLVKECEHYAQAVLTHNWSFMAPQISNIINHITPLLELMECLESYVQAQAVEWKIPFKDLLQEFESKMDNFVQAVHNTDVACVAEMLAFELSPLIQKSLNLIEEKIRPYFEAHSKQETLSQRPS